MIAEPYINVRTGKIEWMDIRWHEHQKRGGELTGNVYVPYSDFEREKLAALEVDSIEICPHSNGKPTGNAFFLFAGRKPHGSALFTIDYWYKHYLEDTESNRLLKRAEFLKAVCKEEGVVWLPEEKVCFCRSGKMGQCGVCSCKCCEHEATMMGNRHLRCDYPDCPKCNPKQDWITDHIKGCRSYGKGCECHSAYYYTKSEEQKFRRELCLIIEKLYLLTKEEGEEGTNAHRAMKGEIGRFRTRFLNS